MKANPIRPFVVEYVVISENNGIQQRHERYKDGGWGIGFWHLIDEVWVPM
jgi:hypothetical protein